MRIEVLQATDRSLLRLRVQSVDTAGQDVKP